MASTIGERLVIAPEVAEALRGGRPVVALESTLISHGLPYPQNLEVAIASEAAVREAGAVPATVAIRDGRLLVGLEADDLEALANAPVGSVRKAARPSLAVALAAGGWAATTVSATMIAAHAAGIRVFATGGIGGVHRGALGIPGSAGPPTLDVSSDLEELARTPARGRVCRTEGDPRCAAHARVPRDARRPGRGHRATRAAGLLCPLERDRRPDLRRRRAGGRRIPPPSTSGSVSEARSSCACRSPPMRHSPRTSRATRSSRQSPRRRRAPSMGRP